MSDQNLDKDLKKKVLKGGVSLAIRQLVTSGCSLMSILIIARVLGPEQYGILASCLGIYFFLVWTNKLGIGVYAVRQSEFSDDALRQVLAFFNTLSILSLILLWVLAPVLVQWTKQPETLWMIRFLALPLWIEMIGDVSMMKMSREIQFTEIGLAETIGQISNYALSIPLVLFLSNTALQTHVIDGLSTAGIFLPATVFGKGYWGPIWGLALQCLVVTLMVRRYQPIPMSLQWTRGCIRPALQGGLGYTGSAWILSLKALTVPLLVTRLAGIEAAGIVSIAIRFAEQLAIFRFVLSRMSITVFAKLIGQPDKIRSALSQGMVYQVLLVAPACAAFSCCASWLIPLLFGEEWLMSAQIFPFVAAGVVMAAMFELHTSTLYAAANNRSVALFNAGFITLQWTAALVALPLLGVWGYGIAEISTIPSYILIHYGLTKLCGSPDYKNVVLLVAATLPALFLGPWVPSWIGLLLLSFSYGTVLMISPSLRRIPVELYGAWRNRGQVVVD